MENEQTTNKQRHGCVTSLLIFLMIINSASAIFYFFAAEFIKNKFSADIAPLEFYSIVNVPLVEKILFGITLFANFISCILLFQWKKLGFWLYVISDLAAVGLDLYQGKGFSQLLSISIGIGILFGVMQIANKNRRTTWEELN